VVEDVGEVAVPGSVEVVHPAAEIERGPVAGDHPVFAALRHHRHPAAYRALLRGARIAGAEPLVLTADRRALLASTYDREQLDANPVMRARLPLAGRLRGRHVLLTQPWATNHFHWMLDTLPRAALLAPGEDAPVIVPDGLTADQRWSLRRAGIAEDRLVPFAPGSHVAVDELVFPSLVGGTGNPPRWALDWLRERLVGDAGPRTRRLYVSRADAALRRVVNEDELFAALEPLGFERLLPGGLPLEEQLRAFAEAEVVVGPHGAGLVSLLACAAGARVIELFAEHYVNGCYYALSDALGLSYAYVLCARAGEEDLRADPGAVRAALG
jgi:capsular polysaccharide biosynthesis protein